MVQEESSFADATAAAEKLAAEFFEALELLYVRVGEPALRTVAARSPRLSPSNLSDLLGGRRKALPSYEVTTALVKALLHEAPIGDVGQALKEWHERWTRARATQRRADRAGQRRTVAGATEDIVSEATARARLAAEQIVAAARAEAEQIVGEGRRLADEAVTATQPHTAALMQHAPGRIRDKAEETTGQFAATAAQLSNDDAAIRLASVYAAARLADDSEPDRRSCLKLLCDYLRLPYNPDTENHSAERLVRTVVQTVIADRLRPEHPGFCIDAEIDLSGACLIDLPFDGVTVHTFNADGARFAGDARFNTATFHGDVRFYRTAFDGDAWFDAVTFNGDARFVEAAFGRDAMFTEATFGQFAGFTAVTFNGDGWIQGARFVGDAGFDGAIFKKDAWFDETTFNRFAIFAGASFGGDVQFGQAKFNENAGFREATFAGNADFNGATFNKDAVFGNASFGTHARFDGAMFRRDHPPVWPAEFDKPAGIEWTDPPSTPTAP